MAKKATSKSKVTQKVESTKEEILDTKGLGETSSEKENVNNIENNTPEVVKDINTPDNTIEEIISKEVKEDNKSIEKKIESVEENTIENRVERIIQRSPSHYRLLMKDGSKRIVPKSMFDRKNMMVVFEK